MMGLTDKPLHPFLFALYPILFLYTHNIEEVPLTATFTPFILAFVFTTILLISYRFVYSDMDKSVTMTSITIILFYSFSILTKLSDTINVFESSETKNGYMIAFSLSIALLMAYTIYKSRRDFTMITKSFNVFITTLIFLPMINIISYYATLQGTPYAGDKPVPGDKNKAFINQNDIYYIILDGYTREDILKSVYGFNNTEFIRGLEDKGFYVASKSRSNYPLTYTSLASSLNMEYINYLSEQLGTDSSNRNIPYQMIKDSNAARILKSLGYTYINLRSGWGATDHNEYADLEYSYSGFGKQDEFYSNLVKNTILQPIIEPLMAKDLSKARIYTFEKLKEIATLEGKTFTLAHIQLPHPPYLFDRWGNPIPAENREWDKSAWGEKTKYVEQLSYTNKKINETIDEILASSSTAPIIILQADHGTSPIAQTWMEDIRKVKKEQLDERIAIFNAYYLPDNGSIMLYESITPVNTFRVIFNYYFDGNFTLLEDKSFFSNNQRPYDWIIVEK